jgi:hypothetical protein
MTDADGVPTLDNLIAMATKLFDDVVAMRDSVDPTLYVYGRLCHATGDLAAVLRDLNELAAIFGEERD